jgi:hypothetical protein
MPSGWSGARQSDQTHLYAHFLSKDGRAAGLSLGLAGLVPSIERSRAPGRVVQPAARAASMMTLVTAPGSLIMDRCGALISVTCAPAR